MKPTLLDSSVWIEFFIDGSLASAISPYLKASKDIIVPTIVLYEVYKKLKMSKGEEIASEATAQLVRGRIVSLTDSIALLAADLSLSHNIPMADAIILASAQSYNAEVVTLDADFKDIVGVTILSK